MYICIYFMCGSTFTLTLFLDVLYIVHGVHYPCYYLVLCFKFILAQYVCFLFVYVVIFGMCIVYNVLLLLSFPY